MPILARETASMQPNLAWWTDGALATASGVRIAFTERTGGRSTGAYTSLNLAAHVGDLPASVDSNRTLLLEALGLADHRDHLTVPEQVHGTSIALVDRRNAGSGAFAEGGEPPVPRTDALITLTPRVPVLLCFADCVPIIIVAPGPAVAVVHAGWRGALDGIAAAATAALAAEAGCSPSEVVAYVGPHIGSCHYEVGPEILSHFVERFGIVARAESGGLDLGSVITRNLTDAGVASCRIASLGSCTAEETDRFYSHRTERGLTGRHGALACIL